jgi:hypothetical protein
MKTFREIGEVSKYSQRLKAANHKHDSSKVPMAAHLTHKEY